MLRRLHRRPPRTQTMICPCSLSRFRWIRRLCSFVCALVGCCSLPSVRAQNLDKPLQSIDEEITAFAYAPDGRIVYSVYRKLKTKVYDALEHDDIWIQDASGKRRRLLEGQKYTRGDQSFSYLIDSFRWSPNGHFILAQLLTTSVLDDSGKTEDSYQTLLLDDSGKEIRINQGDRVIRSEEHTSELQSPDHLVCRLLLEKKKRLADLRGLDGLELFLDQPGLSYQQLVVFIGMDVSSGMDSRHLVPSLRERV